MQDRREDIRKWVREWINLESEERYRQIQKRYDQDYAAIYQGIRDSFERLFLDTILLQKVKKKQPVQYIVISSLRRGRRWEEWQFRFETLDKTFYLDEIEAEQYYSPDFLKFFLGQTVQKIQKEIIKVFPRIQSYEQDCIVEECMEEYERIAAKLFREIMEPVFETAEFAQMDKEEKIKGIFGQFLGTGILLIERSNA